MCCCCYRQHLMLLGLCVPYAHGVVPGTGDDEAGIMREVEEDQWFFMFKYAEDVLGCNIPYLRMMWGKICGLDVINVRGGNK
jgi:hypothetical protein